MPGGQRPGEFAAAAPMLPIAAWWQYYDGDDFAWLSWDRLGRAYVDGRPADVALLQLAAPREYSWDEHVPVRTPHRDGQLFGTRAWWPNALPACEDIWIFIDPFGLVHLDRELEHPTNLALLCLVPPRTLQRRDDVEDDDD